MTKYRLEIFKKASFCRHFENEVYSSFQRKEIKFPIYLSAGQEFIPAALYTVLNDGGISPDVFIQHRGHSHYLCLGGNPAALIDELLGRSTGCSRGMGGSASIQSIEKKLFGHDGLMGSQVPIAVGHCYYTKSPTIAVMGDASAEEDYVLGAFGWASTKNLPILFVVEDNNLSILTEKRVRRNWAVSDIGRAFNILSFRLEDEPEQLSQILSQYCFDRPMLLDISTTRKFWHSGAGQDGHVETRYEKELTALGELGLEIDLKTKLNVEELWREQLEKL